MKTDKTGIILHIKLSKGFMQEVSDVMDDQFDLACQKWGVKLNSEDQKRVIDKSLEQLGRKVSENAKVHWDFGQVLNVRIVNSPSGEITLPVKEKNKNAKKRVIRTRGGWEFDSEDTDGSVSLLEFAEMYKNLVKTWAAAAVFYGVGSYVG